MAKKESPDRRRARLMSEALRKHWRTGRKYGKKALLSSEPLGKQISSIAKASQKANRRGELALLQSLAPAQRCFAGQVIIEERDSALVAAEAAYTIRPVHTADENSQTEVQIQHQRASQQHAFFVDGSRFLKPGKYNSGGAAGAAVVWYHQADEKDGGGVWEERVFPLPVLQYGRALFTEIFAIAEALAIALSQIMLGRASSSAKKVVVFSDCQDALLRVDKLRHSALDENWLRSNDNAVARKLVTRSQYLSSKLGLEVELRWTPGHAKVEGNVRADRAARSSTADDCARRVCAKGVYVDEALRLIFPEEVVPEEVTGKSIEETGRAEKVKKHVKKS